MDFIFPVSGTHPPLLVLGTSDVVHLKFNYLSYVRMVEDYMLTAQFVQALPPIFSKALNINVDDVIVVTITSANPPGGGQKRDISTTSGVIVAIAVPNQQVSSLSQLVQNRSSLLYSASNGQIVSLIDNQYPVTGKLVYRRGGGHWCSLSWLGSQDVNDPNTSQQSSGSGNTDGGGESSSGSSQSGTGGLSRNAIIGIAVAAGVVCYAAATVGAVTAYRRHRRRQQEQEEVQRRAAIQEISAPIILDHSFRGSLIHRAHYQQENLPRTHRFT